MPFASTVPVDHEQTAIAAPIKPRDRSRAAAVDGALSSGPVDVVVTRAT